MLNYDALLLIFKHLHMEDLENVANVSCLWREAALAEKKERNYKRLIYYCTDYPESERFFPIALAQEQIDKLGVQPILGIFCTRDYPLVEFQGEAAARPCSILSPYCDTVVLGTYGFYIDNTGYVGGNEKMMSLFIPDNPNMKIKTIAFANSAENYHELVDTLGDPNDHTKTRCVLLFGEINHSEVLRNVLDKLSDNGYSENNTCLLGGTVETIHACNSKSSGEKSHSNNCVNPINGLAITIVGTKIKAWCIYCKDFPTTHRICNFPLQPDEHGNVRMPRRVSLTSELENLKRKIQLKKHSYGIIFTDQFRKCTYDECETTMFRNVFPEIPFVGYFGHQGIRFQNGRYNLSENNFYTIVLILTYN